MSERTLAILGDQIVDKSKHVGGGSAAAAAASLGAASAELVVFLSDRKSTPDAVSARLQADGKRLTALRATLLNAGDADESALDQLMRAYRSKGDDQVQCLVAAANSSMQIARLAAEIIDIVEASIDDATRFTVSDLGTAAALAAAAAEAALLNATINVALLEAASNADEVGVKQFRQEIADAKARVAGSSARASASVWRRIDPEKPDIE